VHAAHALTGPAIRLLSCTAGCLAAAAVRVHARCWLSAATLRLGHVWACAGHARAVISTGPCSAARSTVMWFRISSSLGT